MFGDTPLWIVETPEDLEKTAKALLAAPVIGVDTESDSFHHYQEKVCLIQFSDLERDYIVDPLAVPDLSCLAPVFADPNIVKIFHGADYDIVCLKRDFGFEFRNLFDTMISAQMIGEPRVGLGDLIGRYFGHEIDKQYQRHDWAKRPLLEEHLFYARGDTHFLLAIREIMLRDLGRVGRRAHVEEECEILQERRWEGRKLDPNRYLKVKGSHGVSDQAKRVLRRLYMYRDSEAKKADRPPFKVLPDRVMVKTATAMPTSMSDLERLFPKKSAMKRRYGKGMIRAVVEGQEDDFVIPTATKPPPPKGPKPRLTGRLAERTLIALKEWRNHLISSTAGMSPVTVASNATLKRIAQQRPTSMEELAQVPDVRRWQVREYGEIMLAVLDSVSPYPPTGESLEESAGDKSSKRRRRRRRKPKSGGESADAG